jgi:spore maturation protein CgeB
LRILYSFNKAGFEATYWTREIGGASGNGHEFIPFNHGPYLSPTRYARAQRLDDLYFERHPGLLRLYADIETLLESTHADALLVDNLPPYHPEFLRRLAVHKVLRTADGPITAYDIDFAYLHAYDQILYHTPAYSPELTMADKLAYCGARRADFWPMGVFDVAFDRTKTEETILKGKRDIDVVFVGAMHLGKMPFLARVKKALGGRLKLRGLCSLKKNAYFNLQYGFPGWVRPLAFEDYVPLYQRAKIGINVHNRGDYSVGNYRLFDLPANGVMQISDGGAWLRDFFEPGSEVVAYRGVDDLVAAVHHYLACDEERARIALNGFRRAMKDHRFAHRMFQAGGLIESAIQERKERQAPGPRAAVVPGRG